MEYTKNYNLKKPTLDEKYNIENFNTNFDTIDEVIGDPLPINSIIEYAGDTAPQGWEIVTENDYSLEEVKTGSKWINGKSIYRKVFDCGNAPNKTLKYIDHNISDLSNIIKITGFLTNGTEWFPLPRLHPTSSYSISVQANTTQILLYDQYDFSNYHTYVILEYTKTTD